MTKKIITISIVILLALGALYGGYLLIRKGIEIVRGPEISPGAPVSVPPSKVKALSDAAIFDYWVSYMTNETFYFTADGKILKAQEGEDELVAAQPVENLQEITQNKDGSLVLVRFGSMANPQYSILNIREKSWQPLPLSVRSAAFSPDSSQIAMLVSSNGTSDVIVQDLAPAGTSPKSRRVLSLAQKGLDIQWLTPGKLLLRERPSDLIASSIWEVDIAQSTAKELFPEKNGLFVQWSENGDTGVRYVSENSVPAISIVNASGAKIGEISETTIPQKCFVSETQIICAAPLASALPANGTPSGLLDRYLKKSVVAKDRLYAYEKKAGGFFLQNTIDDSSEIDALHLVRQGNRLLFINRIDEKLYELAL